MECPGFSRDLRQPGSYLRWKDSLGNRPPERSWRDPCVFLGILVEGDPQGCCAPHASAPAPPANGKSHGFLTQNPAVSFPAEVAKIYWLRCNIHFSMACVGFGCFFLCVANCCAEIPRFGWGGGRRFPGYCTVRITPPHDTRSLYEEYTGNSG